MVTFSINKAKWKKCQPFSGRDKSIGQKKDLHFCKSYELWRITPAGEAGSRTDDLPDLRRDALAS
ncbi:MAG: hypothetical protein EA341_06425 [Mongoliibacter sp.]|nr:MAG: hypothetical protein EA341_06425 [Mongoliibacter sp.]